MACTRKKRGFGPKQGFAEGLRCCRCEKMQPAEPDRHDLEIIRCLRESSRSSTARIARSCDLSVGAVRSRHRKIGRLFIKRYTAIVDWKKLGYHCRLQLVIRPGKEKAGISGFLQSSGCVNSFFICRDGVLIADAVLPDLSGAAGFLERLSGFRPEIIEGYPVTEILESEKFLSEDIPACACTVA